VLRVEPQVIENYVADGTVQLAFWHILDHGASPVIHQAAECAGAQSPLKFWEMHDLLFARQNQLWSGDKGTLTAIAAEAELDVDLFAACLEDSEIAAKVQRMDQERRQAGVRLRPTFDINGRLYPGAQPYANLVAVFDDILTAND
jgi:protein-disulfide isomerase